jgi:hypothetical protein
MAKHKDLGRKLSDKLNSIMPAPDMGEQTDYPSLHIDDADDDMMAMPDKGEANIKYHVKERREHQDADGKKRKSLHLHVTHMSCPEGKKKKKGEPDGGARKALNEYFKDK